MLVFRIITTIFITSSVMTSFIKNAYIWNSEDLPYSAFFLTNLYSTIWRALAIAAIWLI